MTADLSYMFRPEARNPRRNSATPGFWYNPRPMKTVRWGILGCARIAERALIPAFRSTFTFRIASGPEDYRWTAGIGGGALYDVGCYPISAARTAFGAEPRAVYAAARFAAPGIFGQEFGSRRGGPQRRRSPDHAYPGGERLCPHDRALSRRDPPRAAAPLWRSRRPGQRPRPRGGARIRPDGPAGSIETPFWARLKSGQNG